MNWKAKGITAMLIFALALLGCGGGGGSSDTPAGGTDTTPPTVSSTDPANNATGVAINTTLLATFSEDLDCTTVTITTFTLKDASNNPVTGGVGCSGAFAAFATSSDLAANIVYSATITTGVKDAAGDAMAADYTWSFTTGTSAGAAPTVMSITPVNGATGVSTTTAVTATFSAAMDSATITAATFTLKDGANNAVTGAVTYDATSKTATFTPSEALSYSTSYAATLTTGVKDSAGNALASNYTWNFTTTAAQSVVTLTNYTISSPTTWTSDKIYVVDGYLDVNSVLTIEPGTIVKFTADKDIEVYGTLNANGTATAPIVFTSIKDDSHGGDTNGDGSATTPAAGNWYNIELLASDSTFNNCRFYYGGSTANETLSLGTNSATVTNSVFAYNKGGNLTSIYGALNAGEAIAGTVITGNVFYSNDIPVRISTKFNMDASNTFVNPADSTKTNTYNGIFNTSGSIASAITWSETEVPYVIGHYLDVNTGASLTLADNVVIKFTADKDIEVYGSLVGWNQTGVKFTSIKDDTVIGDTNGDVSATSPANNNWGGIWFDSTIRSSYAPTDSSGYATWSNIYYDSH